MTGIGANLLLSESMLVTQNHQNRTQKNRPHPLLHVESFGSRNISVQVSYLGHFDNISNIHNSKNVLNPHFGSS